jgi:hypothetical protein
MARLQSDDDSLRREIQKLNSLVHELAPFRTEADKLRMEMEGNRKKL